MLIGSPAAAACGPDLKADCYAASWNPQPWYVECGLLQKKKERVRARKGCEIVGDREKEA